MTHKLARGCLALTILAATILASQGCGNGGDHHRAQASVPDLSSRPKATGRPNIVLIQTDDQVRKQFTRKVMPRTVRRLAARGDVFTDYIATTAQCCPSRASLITGQYAHNHGVTANIGYSALKDREDVLPVWLQRAGYYTMHVGKYLNGYERSEPPASVAPGWDQWHTVLGETDYYDYRYAVNGRLVRRGHRAADNVTHVLNKAAVRLVRKHAPGARPFYLQLDERAPHGSRQRDPFGDCRHAAIPLRRDENTYETNPTLRRARFPHPPSFNEPNVRDKPSFIRSLPRLGPSDFRAMRNDWACGAEALRGVDRGVARVYRAVKRAGELHKTVFVYISDNGRFFGEHRIRGGKVLPYKPALHLPLVIKAPRRYIGGASPHHRIHAPVANIDLAPTILSFAHGKPCAPDDGCRTMDGRSLIPLLARRSGWPGNRGLLTEYDADHGRYAACRFAGVWTKDQSYVDYYGVIDQSTGDCVSTDERDRYDLASDPTQLHNLCFGGRPARCPGGSRQHDLERRVAKLRHCSGVRGRDPLGNDHDYCE